MTVRYVASVSDEIPASFSWLKWGEGKKLLYRLAVPRTHWSGWGERTKSPSGPGTFGVRRYESLFVFTNCSETQCKLIVMFKCIIYTVMNKWGR